MVNLIKLLYYLQTANRRLHLRKNELKEYQDKRVRSIVNYAYENVPFYHEYYKKHNVDVKSIKQLEDLSKIPIVKKEEFKAQPPQKRLSKEYDLTRLKKVKTSGSTGTPFEVYITPTEDAWRKAIYMRANIACGQKPRDNWVVLTAPTHFNDTTKIQRKIGIFAQNCISLFEPNEEKINQINDAKPNVLDGYSSALVLLAKEVKKRGITSITPHVVFGNAEFIDEDSRKLIEDVFGAPYCDQFGCAEMDRTAWMCLNREGYHMDVDSVITEFIGKDGLSVSNGERGEVTYTSLFNYAMPFIRYAIGDIAIPGEADACSCGCTLPLMKVIEGRRDSFLTFPGNRVFSPLVFNYALSTFSYYRDIDQYQIHQKTIDELQINLKMAKVPDNQETMKENFDLHLRKILNLSGEVKIQIYFVDEIPFSKTGKLRSVWSDVSASLVKRDWS